MKPWDGKPDWPYHRNEVLRDVVRTVWQYRQKKLSWKETIAQLMEVTGLDEKRATKLMQKTANSDKNALNLCQLETVDEALAGLKV